MGYQGFGSFHSDNVQDLLQQTDYAAPSLPFEVSTLPPSASSTHAASHFLLDLASWTFLNHGAFGAPFAHAQAVANQWRQHAETQPLRFMDRELLPHVVHAQRTLASIVHCRPVDLALLPNATTGLNAVLRSAVRHGDVVFSLDIGYGGVKKMIQAACAAVGARHVEGRVLDGTPICEEAIVACVERDMPANTTLAVFDAVTSNTALALPMQRLTAYCTTRQIPVLVDAAHALGQLPSFCPATMGASYVVFNCHKWFCAPRGCAAMWVDPAAQPEVHPLNASHGAGAGFASEFIWDGNRDYSAWLALPAVVECWRALGLDATVRRNHALLEQAVAMLCARWRTTTLAPLSMCGSMALVAVPQHAQGAGTSAEAKALQDTLFAKRIEAPIKAVMGKLYVRVSCALYNELAQYKELAAALAPDA